MRIEVIDSVMQLDRVAAGLTRSAIALHSAAATPRFSNQLYQLMIRA
jgi:hypothetical protein